MSALSEIQRESYNNALSAVEGTNRRLVKAYIEARKRVLLRIMRYETLWKTGAEQAAGVANAVDLYRILGEEVERITGVRQQAIALDFAATLNNTYTLNAYGMEQHINITTSFINAGTGERWGLGYTVLPTDSVEAALSRRVGGLTFQERGTIERVSMTRRLRDKLAASIASGDSIDDAADILKAEFDIATGRATRIARTEILRAYSYGNEESTKKAVEAGVSVRYVWDATLDGRTREDHQVMDQKEAEVVDGKPVFTLPNGETTSSPRVGLSAAESVNCRCRRLDIPAGFEPTTRVAKVEGEWKKVGQVSYADFKDRLSP